jgi:hypothetical protein
MHDEIAKISATNGAESVLLLPCHRTKSFGDAFDVFFKQLTERKDKYVDSIIAQQI